jgi:hypothetical protein
MKEQTRDLELSYFDVNDPLYSFTLDGMIHAVMNASNNLTSYEWYRQSMGRKFMRDIMRLFFRLGTVADDSEEVWTTLERFQSTGENFAVHAWKIEIVPVDEEESTVNADSFWKDI